MKKKFLALVLTLAMVLSLVPVTALAAGETTNEDVIVKPAESQTYPEGVDSLSKTAVKADGENTYDVTLEVKMHETTTTTSQAAATVLVIDVSNSMDWHVVCGRDEHKHTRDCYTFGWLTCEETEHTHTDACGESRLDAAKAAAENFVNTYAGSVENAGRYLSIVVFGTTASVKLDWTDVSTDDGKENVISAIDEIGVNGGTNLEQGLAKAKDQFDDPTVTSVNFKNVVALTDGAPTYYGLDNKGEPSGGNGSSGSEKINTKTAKTAGKLKEVANLYTVCFGAANQYTYTESDWWGNITHGPTVGEFLRNNIATDSNHAYDADNAGALNSVFEKISETITSGISAGVVHDALPTGVTSSAFNGETTADWDLNTFDKQTSDEGNTKHYTYTKTYTVTIGPDEIDSTLLYENVYYPLNGETTLKVNVDNEEQELNFQIPYGKVTFNTYSVTYKDGVNGAVFEDNTTNDLRKGATIPGFAGESSIEREGYTFSGWKWYQGETELTAKPDTMPAADLVAVAQWTANTYTVTWKDWNGTELKKVEKVAYGTTASDVAEKAPADPSRASSAQYDYTFTGWDKEYADVTGDQVYTAQYRETAKTYTVTWKDWNGTELKKVEEVAYGTTASDVAEKAPADPSRASSAQYDYTFTSWDKEYADVTGDQVYTAQYKETAKTYTVTWKDWNGTELKKVEEVAYGTTASDVAEKAPADPSRASSAQYDYTFTGWDKEYADVTGDQVYTAQYKETAKTYTVTWKDWNGTELKKVEEVAYGTTASDVAEKAPADPSRASSAQYDYTFTGWDKEYADVTGDQVYTAQYRETAVANLDYKIIQHFRDAKGNEIEKLRVDSPKTITAADAEKITSLNTLVEKEGMAKNMTDASSNNYVYVPNETTFKADGKDVTTLIKGTQIDLYYYLDNWKDGDSKTPTEGDSETGGDGIPDCYQVLVKYQSGDTNRGSVGPLTMEVLTIKNKENVSVGEGQVVASGSTATATGNRCYFSRWTNDAKVETSTAGAALGQQTIANAKGGATYTFTANFDRSSGGGSGGSNRPKPPVVEIPDDVPTGLNGKDHYAYVVGYPDGMVYPQKNITRAEVATIFFRLLKDETREANMTKSNSYNDMKDGAWYTCAVSTLSKMGIIKGYEDGSFKPDASISRAEFAAIAARFDPDGDKTPATFSDVSSHWAKDEISIAANHGWIKGYEDGSFKPDQKITRAETMTLVNRVLKRLPETKDDLHKDMKTWPDNQKESAWFYLAVQEATNSHYQKLKKDGTHETWESMRETRDWAALEK